LKGRNPERSTDRNREAAGSGILSRTGRAVSSGQAGFTLIELSIVLLLIGLMFRLSLPAFSDLTGANLRSTSRKISSLMRYVFSEAAFRKTYFSLVFDLEKRSYWVETPILNTLTQEMEMMKVEDEVLARPRTLGRGISFREVKIGSLPAIREGRAEVHFYPGGYADPATIHLKDNKEREYSIFLVPFSGRVLVREGYYEFSDYAQ